jgi:capsule polysaccharide export protein KpsE/RkpR
MYERAVAKKKNYIDSLNARLTFLSKEYGLTNYQAQTEEVTKGYLRTVDGDGSSVRDREVNELKANIEEQGGEMLILQNLIQHEVTKYIDMKDEYEKAYMDFDRRFSYTNIITHPYPADKKSYPIRWLVVLISALSAFFISFIVILVLENYRGLSANTAKS